MIVARALLLEPFFVVMFVLKNATFYFMNVGAGTKKSSLQKKFSRVNFDKLTKFAMKLLCESNRVLINKHIHHQT